MNTTILIKKYEDRLASITFDQRTDDAMSGEAYRAASFELEQIIADLKATAFPLNEAIKTYSPDNKVSYGGGIYDGDVYHEPYMREDPRGRYVRLEDLIP